MISSVPLSSQISPSQEQEPSQEEYEPSPSETIKVDTADTKTEEENQELELDSDIIKKETSFLEDIKNTSNDQQEEEGVAVINTENNITENIVTENNNSATDDNNKVTENNISVTDDSIKETEHNNSVIDDNIKETENNNNNSVTDDNIKDPLNIEAAQLEISDILNNNNNTITNIETNTDCQNSPSTSPLLTYVVDMDSLPVSQVSQVSTTSLQRLEYDVIHATSWDDNYPPHQLLPKDKNSSKEGQIKHGKGWQSARYCTYPQEIILQASCGVARIRKLQILSHHYKIATRLEIYVGSIQRRKEMVGKNTNTGGSLDEKNEKRTLSWDKLPKIIENDSEEDESSEENDYDIIRSNGEPYILFKRLGYCALDSNERANYKARELKSVRLDTEGEYIRLVARRCYENDLNKYKQVGIVGITIMGEPADYLLAGESQKIPFEHVDEGLSRVASPETCIIPLIQDNNWIVNDQRNFTSLYSILPNSSLSVSNNNSSTTTTPLPNNTNDQTNRNKNPVIANDFLSNGEETENLLAAFGRAKQDAVKVEDFNLAKVLKYCTEYVKQAAVEVRKFDGLKKQAVEEEDFDNAEKYKHEAEGIRENVRMTLADEGLNLDDSGEVIVCDPSLNDIIGLADNAEDENQQLTGVPSGNEHQFQQDHFNATSAYMPKSRTNSNASNDRSGAQAPEPIFPFPSMPKSRTSSDASVNRYLGGSYNNYTCEQQQEPSTPTYSTTPLPWTPFVDDRHTNSSKVETDMLYPPQDESDELVPLSDLARSAFALSIPYFGDEIIACILSKKLAFRESAISEITKRIDVEGEGLNIEGIDKLSLVKATYQVMREVLDDNREELALQVSTLWEKLIKFCVHHQIPNSSTWKLIDNNYELLLSKIADSNDSIKQSSVDLFILLAKTYRTPTQSVLSLVLKPAKTSSQPLKKAKPTVELIIRLVEEFGVVKIPKGKFDKDNKLSLDAIMEVSISYLNNNNAEVRDAAVKFVFEIIKRMGKAAVGPYLIDVQPLLLESILNLVTEWEEETGKVAGEVPSPPASPKQKPKGLTEEVNYEVDETLLQKPLAARGTVSRIEQQLMEVRYMMNTTNHIIKDDYDNYLANATKSFHQDDIDEEEAALAAEEALLVAELEAAELEEEQIRQAESSQKRGKTAAATSKKTSSTSKSAAPSKTATAKKSKDDGKAAPSKKTSTSKSSAASSKGAAKPVSRRGSTDDVKSTQKVVRKNSVNSTTQNKLTTEPEKIADEPDESKSDRCCIFCDVHDERFTEENLVTHYWNDCPVLTNCRLCNIILEISTLDDHMLNDCDKSKFVKQCPRCREVIEADDYLEHMAKQSCIAIRQDIVRCPLCKTVVKPATEQGWKAHLLNENGCTKNRRKSKATSMVKEMEAAATAEKREKKSTSTTKSSATSKAPARKPAATSKDKPKKASTAKVSKVKK